MFCDMVGSTALSTRLDPEEQRDVVSAFQSCCADEVSRLGGMVAQYHGDGVLAYFGYPAAHEDDAERAARAALAIVDAVEALKPSGVSLQARVGIASGVVVVGDLARHGVTQENAAIGETTNLAARLQSLAEPSTIVISSETHRLTRGLFDYRDLGPVEVKGFANGVHARQLLGVSKIDDRFEARQQSAASPLLGRDEELDMLLRRWEQAKRGQGRAVLLIGEAGIGKSRLTRAVQEQLAAEPHIRAIYHCSSYHQDSALHPVIAQLQRGAGIGRDDDDATKLNKLEYFLSQSSENVAEDMTLFAKLLSIPVGERYPPSNLSPQRVRERTLAVLLSHMGRLAERQPMLMIFEDLHWIDPTSLELLSLAVDRLKDQRVLLLATARPEFTPPWPSHRHISSVFLTRLDKTEGEALVTGVTGGKLLPSDVIEQIVKRTDGVPLFIEELTKTILESGLLRETDNRYELVGPLPPLAIPATLHASLLARLDRLASVRDVAQTGATIGREFSYGLIAAVAGLSTENLNAALSQLVAAELIFQRGVPPEANYQFKHALVQDAAYASLVRSRRQQLHGQIARAFEQEFPDVVGTEPETLAYHYTEASLPGDAIPYWLKAGQRAAERSADQEAIRHLRRGIALLQTLPETPDRGRRELDFQIALGTPLASVGGYASLEVGAASERAILLAEKVGEVTPLFVSLYAQYTYLYITGRTRRALELAQRLHALGRRQDDRVMQMMAHRALGVVLNQLGQFESGCEQFEQALSLYDPARDTSLAARFLSDPFASTSALLSIAVWMSGYPERAAQLNAQALDYAAGLNHVHTNGLVHYFAAQLDVLSGNPGAALAHTRKMSALGREHGVAAWENHWAIWEGWAIACIEQPEKGIPLIQGGIAGLDDRNLTYHLPHYVGLLAHAHARAGNLARALELSIEARTRAARYEEAFWEAELYRNEGEIKRAAGHASTEVEECFLRAVEISRNQGAKMLELRAATALTQLWFEQGRRAAARDLLAPICGWFTEGFDTVYLREAKALLAELSKPSPDEATRKLSA